VSLDFNIFKMIIRIVKLTLQPEAVETFLRLFEERKHLIRNFQGCKHLELWKNADRPHQFFTYSLWEDAAALENYRQSGFFGETWQGAKQMFAGKAEAWSVEQVSVS
jgi:heme-degrading monooxygenase HmoA